MKNYAKIGNRVGRPAYRTASAFRYKKHLKNLKTKIFKKYNDTKGICK